jgi:pimeloyl-ACP methyl ester carboxylesterase
LCSYATRFARGEAAGSYPSASLARLVKIIPVGLYTGGRSHPALRLITAELADRIDGARLLDVPAAGHAVQMAKDVLVDALLALAHDADLALDERGLVTRTNPDGE